MKNKFTRKDYDKVAFDFTIKNNKVKRISKGALCLIGYTLGSIAIVAWLWVLYMLAYACM